MSQPYVVAVTVNHETSTPTVTDNAATIADPAVVATVGAAVKSVEGTSTGSVALATFVDPGGPEVVGDYSATIDWGDGTAPDTTGVVSFNAATKKFTLTGSHVYAEESSAEHPGSTPYQVKIVIHHELAPDSNTVTDTATVSDPAVIATPATAITGTEGLPLVNVPLATFTDPGGPEALADYTASISWGDGSAASAGVITFNPANNVFTVSGTHTYLEESSAEHPASQPYGIVVTITHEKRAKAIVKNTATIADPAVVATAAAPITGVEGATTGAVAVATFVDPGGPSRSAIIRPASSGAITPRQPSAPSALIPATTRSRSPALITMPRKARRIMPDQTPIRSASW